MKQSDIFENEQKENNRFAYNIFTHIDHSVPETKLDMFSEQVDNWNSNNYEEVNNSHAPGAKLDQDKPDLDLVLGDFAKALQEVGKIGTFGAKKYSEHGWLSVPNAPRRYSSALLRHTFQYKEGDELDEESGFSHLAHAAWNALAVLELYLRNKENNE